MKIDSHSLHQILSRKSTEELLEIYSQNDHSEYIDEVFEIIPRILADRDVDCTVSKANPQPTEEPKQTSPITAPDNNFSDERFEPIPVSFYFYFWVTVISLIDLLGLLSILGSLSTMRTGRGHTGRAGAEFIALAIFLLPLIVYFYYSSGMKAETLREHRYFIVLGKYFPILVVLMRLLVSGS